MKIIKNILFKIVPVAVLAFVITAVIAYQRGVYDITFIERPETRDATSDSAADTTVTLAPEPDTTAPPEDTAPSELNVYLESLESTEKLISGGYSVTDKEYTKSFAIARLTTEIPLPSTFSLRTRTELVPERVPNEGNGVYTTVMTETTVDRPAVEIYMDYIMIDNGSTVSLMSGDGKTLKSQLNTEEYRPAYTRDKADRALFAKDEPSQYNPKNTITKYYYLDPSGSFAESDYNDAADSRGLYMNYPSYYGKSDNDNAFAAYNGYLYGYVNSKGGARTGYKYKAAYNFSEGLAAVVNSDGYLLFINEKFSTAVSELPQYRYKNYHRFSPQGRRVHYVYLLPDTFGEESFGFLYFDHGLVRVRRQIIDAPYKELYNKWTIFEDEDILVRASDTVFPTPTDYRIVSYSNGMILLEKDGLYGFMDYTGKWVVQPVWDTAGPFCEGLAVLGKDGKVGVIDTSGEFVVPMLFDHVENISGGIIAAYEANEGWILLNKLTREPKA